MEIINEIQINENEWLINDIDTGMIYASDLHKNLIKDHTGFAITKLKLYTNENITITIKTPNKKEETIKHKKIDELTDLLYNKPGFSFTTKKNLRNLLNLIIFWSK